MTLPRLYPILDSAACLATGLDPVGVARTWLEGGIRFLQFRHKGFWDAQTVDVTRELAAACRQVNAYFVVNDRPDIAAMVDAGVHLGQDDLSPRDLTGALRRDVVGWSTHNERQLRESQSQPATYVALGPVFSTHSKQNPDPAVGLDNLRAWRPLTARPLVAIGGITRHNAGAVLDAGADSVAVIGDLIPTNPTESIAERLNAWQQLLER